MSPTETHTDFYHATHARPEGPSAWEQLSRLRKAIRLEHFLLAHGYTSENAAAMTEANWSQIGSLAGVRPPSPETVALVIELLQELEAMKGSA